VYFFFFWCIKAVPKYDDFQHNGHTSKLTQKILKEATQKQAERHRKQREWEHKQHQAKQKADFAVRKSNRERKRQKVKEKNRRISDRARATHRGGAL